MHLLIIGWGYVALMMAIAEATNPAGTVLGALVTFVLYGVVPVSIVLYLMGTPGRKRRLREKQAAESEKSDAGSEPPADAVPPVRKEE